MAGKTPHSCAKVHCSKCGYKHNRPLGVRYQLAHNSSAPAPDLYTSGRLDPSLTVQNTGDRVSVR